MSLSFRTPASFAGVTKRKALRVSVVSLLFAASQSLTSIVHTLLYRFCFRHLPTAKTPLQNAEMLFGDGKVNTGLLQGAVIQEDWK